MNEDGSLRVAADLANLAAIRSFIVTAAESHEAGADEVADLVLAVDEAVTNVIMHGYQGRPGWIQIEVTREAGDVVIRVQDDASPFDPTTVPNPVLTEPLEDRQPGGLGVFLIRQHVDEMQHQLMPEGGNELILRKRLAARGQP